MFCDVCKEKQANVFFTQIINGQVQKVNLCDDCSKQKGVTDPTGFALAELLLGMGHEAGEEAKPGELTCEECGLTHSDFKRAGRLGCAHCYEVFHAEIDALLKNIHKGSRHVGKVPSRAAASAVTHRLESLRTDLAKAIDDENFEDAARLRDEINRLAQDSTNRVTDTQGR
jgi:protein arginine kinase activator